MALKATIFKVDLQVADLDRQHYGDYSLTIARHPSETDERMMARVLAFAMHADEALAFTKGLCADDEPDLWRKELTGEIDLWIDLGQPDTRRIRKACGRARRVWVLCYSGRSAQVWWRQVADELQGLDNLAVSNLPGDTVRELAALTARGMRLNCTVQEGQIWLSDGERTVLVEPEVWKGW